MYWNNIYDRWFKAAFGPEAVFVRGPIESVEELRDYPLLRFVTPDECIALVRDWQPRDYLKFWPLVAGFDPALAWEHLELVANKVMPHIDVVGPADSWPRPALDPA